MTKESYYDEIVVDPYRNLEDLNNAQIVQWFREQADLADSIIFKLPYNKIVDQTLELENLQKNILRTFRIESNGAYSYLKKDKEDGIVKLYYRPSIDAEEQMLFNPDEYQKGFYINYYLFSNDNSKIAISVALKGEKDSELIVYDLYSKTLLSDKLKMLSPGHVGIISWFPDNSGFYYTQVPHFNYEDPSYLLDTKGTYFKLGRSNDENPILFSKQNNPDLPFEKGDVPVLSVLNDGDSYLVGIMANTDDYSNVYISGITDLDNPQWKQLYTKEDRIRQFFIKDGYLIYRTSKEAPNYMICRTPLDDLDFKSPEILVPEDKDSKILDFAYLDGNLYYTNSKNGVESSFFRKDSLGIHEIELPYPSGSSSILTKDDQLFITISGWTAPKSYFKYFPRVGNFERADLNNTDQIAFKDIKVEEIEIPSYDGTMVPVSLLYQKGMEKNRKNRALIYTYGSYGLSFSPRYFIPFLVWVQEGGMVVLPHVRGGGEKGNDWYESGKKELKPNTWKDLIATAEFLVEQGYSAPEYIVNYGISAGGIAVGRSITDRPDLFKVAIMDSPALNMLRYEVQPNGPVNIPEFGSIKDSIGFKALLEMDSYLHLDPDKSYPSTMIKVGMKDGSVTPWDPGKYIARAQNLTVANNPMLLSVDFESGHAGDGTYEGLYRNVSELFAFALWQTGHPDYQQIEQSSE